MSIHTNLPLRRAIVLLCATLGLVVGAASVPARGVQADTPGSTCAQWVVSGTWQTSQSNNYHLTFSFSQSGTAVTGTAQFSGDEGARAGYGGAVSGPLTGTLVGNHLDFVVNMPPKRDGTLSRGHYTGTVSSGTVSGTARDDAVQNGPTITWSGSGPTSCASSGGASATGPSATSSGGAASNAVSNWSGTWSTDFGSMQLTQSGTSVTGTYDYMGGKVTGRASGNTLTGTWSQQPSYQPPNDAGDFQFTMSADGQSFTGQWRYGSSGNWSSWNGTRASSAPSSGSTNTPSSGGNSSAPTTPPSSTGSTGTGGSNTSGSGSVPASFAPVWTETEYGGGCNGTWSQQSGGIYAMSQTCPNGVMNTATLTITVNGSQVSIARTQSSDGNNCTYQGTLSADGSSMSGTYSCTLVQPPPPGSWSATAGTAAPSTGSSGGVCNWGGTWNLAAPTYVSSPVTLSQTGSQVTGDDGFGDQLSATVAGSQLTGSWSHGSDNWAVTATMSGDCNSFTGTMGANNGNGSSALFSGTRLSGSPTLPSTPTTPASGSGGSTTPSGGSSSPSPAPAQACSWAGKWDTKGQNGIITLTQNGAEVTGGDGGAFSMNGTVSGANFTGTWSYGSDHGAIILTMDSSCNSFSGFEGLNGSTSVTPQTGQAYNGTRVGGSSPPAPASNPPASGGQLQKLGGIDFNSYCQSLGDQGASLDGGTINDWHCVDSSGNHVGIDVGAACQYQYHQANAIGRWDNFNDPNSWACFGAASSSPAPAPNPPSGGGQLQKLGPIDWKSYCKSIGNAGASLDGGTINDWHCVDSSGNHVGIDVGAACQYQYHQANAVGRWDNFNDPNSWACFGATSTPPSGGSSGGTNAGGNAGSASGGSSSLPPGFGAPTTPGTPMPGWPDPFKF